MTHHLGGDATEAVSNTVANPRCGGRAGPSGGDGNDDFTGAMNGREDCGAEGRVIRSIHKNLSCSRINRNSGRSLLVVHGGDHEPSPLKIGALVRALDQRDPGEGHRIRA